MRRTVSLLALCTGLLFLLSVNPAARAEGDIVAIPGVFSIDSLLDAYPLGDRTVRSEEIAWDSVSSMHLIQISGSVAMHFHEFHSENVMVVRGAGRLTLAGRKYKVKAGEIIHIPKGTKHSFHNLGAVPAVLISVFAPGFDGKDRVVVVGSK
jgi:mannose-6-phosphate isomerase-like protein (cupin superfamily)